ncbi:MAG: ATP-binding cassette domain-containing protein [Maricaulaceae bacterium]
MNAAAAGLQLEDVTVTLNGAPLFEPLSLVVRRGETVALTGPSGSGKSSLLAGLAGVNTQALTVQGRIVLNGRDLSGVAPEKRRMGLMFQDAVLFPHLSVAQNLGFGLSAAVKGAARRDRIEAALKTAGLAGYGPRDPAHLSGGERARVALMRTLLAEPEAVLLDEPFSKLDPARRAQIRAFVFEALAEQGVPCLMATHDGADAAAAGGRSLALTSLTERASHS